MRIPFSWLKEFVCIEGLKARDIAEVLSLKSVEATVEVFSKNIKGVVYGRIHKVEKHLELSILKISIGKEKVITVVTSDTSLNVGEGVLVALPGASIEGKPVFEKKIGGIVSQGLIMTASDLGLEDAEEGVLKLEGDFEPGTEAEKLLGFGEEILELDITPNRGDLLSVRGLARELSALLNLEKKEKKYPNFKATGEIEISLEDKDCKRYRGAVIKGIKPRRSPLWLRVRLWQSGFKTINSIVDVTNYILIEEGQPLHAFDLDTLCGGITVRKARKGEVIRTLEGEEKELNEEILIIADEEKPIAIAGIVGGLHTAVNKNTRNILLEAAYFEPLRIRKGSRILSIKTESSYRFERNTDIERLKEAQNKAIQLLLETSGGKLESLKDVYPEPFKPKTVFLSAGKFSRYTGEDYNEEEIENILSRLEIPYELKKCGVEVFIPSHRSFDMSRDVDLIEEIVRVKGYDSFPSIALNLPVKTTFWRDELLEIKKFLRDQGFQEIITISYEDAELYTKFNLDFPSVEILNPLQPSQRFMRASLIPSLIKTALYNNNHYNYDIAIFEVGHVFNKEKEEVRAGILLQGFKPGFPLQEWNLYDLSRVIQGIADLYRKRFHLESINIEFLHPHAQAAVFLGKESIGFIGKLHPTLKEDLNLRKDVLLAEIKLDPLFVEEKLFYKTFSRFPPVIRDLALLMDKNVSVSKLLNEIQFQLGDKVEKVMVFDLYTGSKVGEGKKSVGVRIILRSKKGSLSAEEVNTLMETLIHRLKNLLGVEIR